VRLDKRKYWLKTHTHKSFKIVFIEIPINLFTINKCLDKKQKKSLLEILLNLSVEYPDRITDRDIREEVDTFLFEGHDTSSVALILTLTLLGIHQDVQVSFKFRSAEKSESKTERT